MTTPDALDSATWHKRGAEGGFHRESYLSPAFCYSCAVTADYRNPVAWTSLGNAGGHRGNPDRTPRYCYEKALAADPNYSYAWSGLGTAGGGEVDGVKYDRRACCVRALELTPKISKAWYILGRDGGGRVGDVEYDQRACYLRALELDPKFSYAWYDLACVGGGRVLGRLYTAQECKDVAGDPTRWLNFGAPAPESPAAPTGSSEVLLRRLVDLDRSEAYPEDFMPIVGVMKSPLLSVEDAATNTGVEDMDVFGFTAAEAGARLARGCPHGLDKDEAGALYLYSADSPLYRELNARLLLRDRERLKCFFPLLRLMTQARNKLPVYARTVYRGVDQNLKGEFQQGQEFYWWSFTSTTKRMAVTEEFLGSQEQTLFMIEASSGRDISAYSAIGGEDEVLLFPGAKMKVVSIMDRANVHMVQLQEVPIKFDLLK